MNDSVVTILIAAYNEEKHIAKCIESILNQNYQPLEVIVIDDGSTDSTAKIIMGYSNVQYVYQQHQGKAAALNLGAQQAHGEVLIFVDADMVFQEDYVKQLAEPIFKGECLGTSHASELVANPDQRWSVCCQKKLGLPAGNRLLISDAEFAEGSLIFRAIRKDVFLKVQGFDNLGFLDDQTLSPKLSSKARWVKEAVCFHYNTETLKEVWSEGTWKGKSIGSLHGAKSLLYYFPAVSLIRAVRSMLRYRTFSMFIYDLVLETGIFVGTLDFLSRRRYGK